MKLTSTAGRASHILLAAAAKRLSAAYIKPKPPAAVERPSWT